MTRYEFGRLRIDRIVESICTDFAAQSFFPEVSEDEWARHRGWMVPRALNSADFLVLTMQGFLVRTRHHTILVDTCVGDHKARGYPFWNKLKLDTFLPRLKAAGVSPEDVNYVMCTHLHSDHVGWNTRLQDGRWVPTFPNAKYVFARREWQSFEAMHRVRPQPQFADSVLPIMEARQALLVDDGFAIDDEVFLEPTPGHTEGHVCVRLDSGDALAVITGDCIHSPVQCREPHWVMRADADSLLASKTRQRFLERCHEANALVCATHFPEPSFGRVVRHGGAFRFDYEGEARP
jgi:glyoxylase-like metal-dependent hydrolase (beta-lactamase superfamily II)